MKRSLLTVAALGLFLPTEVGVAQSPRPRMLEPGDSFPEVDIFDATGEPFDTKSLTGQYTVVVNGCLT